MQNAVSTTPYDETSPLSLTFTPFVRTSTLPPPRCIYTFSIHMQIECKSLLSHQYIKFAHRYIYIHNIFNYSYIYKYIRRVAPALICITQLFLRGQNAFPVQSHIASDVYICISLAQNQIIVKVSPIHRVHLRTYTLTEGFCFGLPANDRQNFERDYVGNICISLV